MTDTSGIGFSHRYSAVLFGSAMVGMRATFGPEVTCAQSYELPRQIAFMKLVRI